MYQKILEYQLYLFGSIKWRSFNSDYFLCSKDLKDFPERLQKLIRNYFIRKALAETKDQLITEAINFHLDFLYLHPFQDGNGRTARKFLNQELKTHKLHFTITTQIRPEYNKKLMLSIEQNNRQLIADYIKSQLK